MVPGTLGGRRANLSFFLGLLALLLAQFALLRAGLIYRTWTPGAATAAQLRSAFVVGARFDLATACFIAIPAMLACHLPWTTPARGPRARRWFLWSLTAIVGAASFILLCEYEFFREFRTRFNQLAIRYFDHPAIVGGMLWYEYPVLRYLAVGLVAAAIFHFGLRGLMRLTFPAKSAEAESTIREPNLGIVIGSAVAILATIVIGARGGLQHEPLRWGDAFKGDNEYANQMSLNGLYSLANAAGDMIFRGSETKRWTGGVATADTNGDGKRDDADAVLDARRLVQSMIVSPNERLLDPANRTALRVGNPGSRLTLRTKDGKPPNVVIVLMEGFSARFVGACGQKSYTPRFDEIARGGTVFDRAFSAGTHTHQGIFASQLGFPNLPGYESLMESSAGNQEFLSAAEIFHSRGYKTFFLYNGQFYWDNMIGFFKKQGVETFVGRPEMEPTATYVDPVWGVADGDTFTRADQEFDAASKKGPFFATVLTLSNHIPFHFPAIPGLAPVTDQGEMNARLSAMGYADWSVGQFIADARKHDYFADTLFVFVGDHGFTVPPVLTELQLLYHHVPMVYFAPGLIATDEHGTVVPNGLAGVVDHRVATHMNIIPSILGLLGLADSPQSAWGRSLFNDRWPDDNFAVIKNTGGGRVVGLLRDDKLMIVGSAGGKPLLMRYVLGDAPAVTPLEDAPLQAQMERELRAYVRAGLDDLTHNRAGPVDGNGAR